MPSISLERGMPEPSAAELLRSALADPSLDIVYRHSATATWVDDNGTRVEQVVLDSGRCVTPLERDGDWVAALIHDPALLEKPEQLQRACAAVGTNIDSERLKAELRAQVRDEQASRARVLAASDRQRRRFERNLHDGAQQRLVGLALTLQLAGRRADAEGANAPVTELLTESIAQLEEAISDLLELARGLHPAIVNDAGLAAAVETLAERSGIPVDVCIDVPGRLPDSVEVGAYYLIAESITNTNKHSGAARVTVSASVIEDALHISVSDDGHGGAATSGSGLVGLADRLAALGGQLTIDSEPGRGTTITGLIPLKPVHASAHELLDHILLRVVSGDDEPSKPHAVGPARQAPSVGGDLDRRRRALKWMVWHDHAGPEEIIDAQPEDVDLLYAKALLLFLGGNAHLPAAQRNWVIGYLTAAGYSEAVLEAAREYDDSDDFHALMGIPGIGIARRVLLYDALRTVAMASLSPAPADFDPVLRAADGIGLSREVVVDLHEIVLEEARLRARRHEIVVASAMPKLLHDLRATKSDHRT